MEATDTVQCPLCMEYFPFEYVENHAATCYGQVKKTATQSNNESENR